MDRRMFLKNFVGSSILASSMLRSSIAAEHKTGAKNSRPNLLFVMADQFRNHALGFLGKDPVITPNFDKFAKEGQYLTNAISSYPVCSPFRAMMMTGRYPFSTGMTFNCLEGLEMGLNRGEVCIGDALKDAGYNTGYIGKWHLDTPSKNYSDNPPDDPTSGSDAWTPPGLKRHGFDFWYAYNTGREHFNQNYWTGDSPKKIVKEKTWSVDHETDVAMNFINKNSRDDEKPFALFLSWNPPHPPYVAPRDKIAFYDENKIEFRPNVKEDKIKNLNKIQRNYFSAVTSCDENFGRLLELLERKGLTENTLVIFTADHGELLGSHGHMGKDLWYEESANIPFLLRMPGRIKKGENDMLFGAFDIMPTLLGLLDIDVPEVCQGQDMSAIIKGEKTDERKSIPLLTCPAPANKYWEMGNPVRWVRHGRCLGNRGYDWTQLGYRGVRTKRYTYVVTRSAIPKDPEGFEVCKGYYVGDFCELPPYKDESSISTQRILYDNLNDEYQMNPVISKNADNEIMKELENELALWLEEMKDPFYFVL